MLNNGTMIHPIEVLIIVFAGLSIMDVAERYKMGKSLRELKRFKNLSYVEKKYIEKYKHFFRPEPWHALAVFLLVAAIIKRFI